MFDYSMMDNVNRIIAEGATKTISKENFIRHEIDEYLSSKTYKRMIQGYNYYIGKHDILNKKMNL